MAIALVNQAVNQAFSTSCVTSISTTLGNTIIVQVQHQSNTSVTVTDSAGNVYSQAGNSNSAGATAQRLCSTWYCLNANAVTSVTATIGSSNAINVNVSQWSGIGSFNVASTANVSSGAITSSLTPNANDMVVAMAAWTAASRAEALQSPFTALTAETTSTTYAAYAYDLGVAAGSLAVQWNSISATVGIVMAAFSPPAVPSVTWAHTVAIG